ncbi:MAG: M4 family metallopeptidase [Chloroflexi bacterium]|nr:M4 family metallopeptidase [Chloroflexota bacterium]
MDNKMATSPNDKRQKMNIIRHLSLLFERKRSALLAIFVISLVIPTLMVFAAPGRSGRHHLDQVAAAPQSTIYVSTTDDELNVDGDCSLREAITAANVDDTIDACVAGSGADEISLPAGTYQIDIWGMQEDNNETGDLDILQDVSIVGADGRATIVRGDGFDTIFHIMSGVTAQIRSLTLQNGGVGAIYNLGDLTIQDSTLKDNVSDTNGGAMWSEGTLNVSNTTFSNNDSDVNGGAIYLRYGTATIVNSTFSGNIADGDGGGIASNYTDVTLNNVTIFDNIADNDEAVWGDGGGIIVIGGTVDFSNTVIAGNEDTTGEAPDCNVISAGVLQSQDYNLIQDTTGCTISGTTTNNIYGQDPLLAALVNNGGHSDTHVLTVSSPAIDSANPSTPSGLDFTCEETDQRGVNRPQNGDGDEIAVCDMGAYEVEGAALTTCGGVFPAVKDSSIFDYMPDTSYGDGSGIAVYQNISGAKGRALIGFNLAGDIPANVNIIKAELELDIYESGPPYPYQFEVYNLKDNFVEDTVTWNTQPELGDLYAAPNSEIVSGTLFVDVTALAVGWIQGTISETIALVPGGEMDQSFKSRETGNGSRLVIYCAQPSDPVPPDLSGRDQAQQAGLTRLQDNSEVPVMIDFGFGGGLRFAGFQVSIPTYLGPNRLDQAQWFLNAYSDTLRLDDIEEELQLVRRSEDGRHLFFRQRVDGIPVFPSGVAVHIQGDDYIGINGGYVPDLVADSTPSLSAQAAEQIAWSAAGGNTVAGETQLRYINLGLLGSDDEITHLSWLVNVAEGENAGHYYIDAHTGVVLLWLPYAIQGYDLELSTANHYGANYGVINWDKQTIDNQWFDENGPYSAPPDPTPPTPDAEGTAAFGHSKTIYDYYKNTFGRDSFDGHGQLIRHFVHILTNWKNAQYVPKYDVFEYGDGMAVLDIIAHEFTHGFTQKTSKLVYQGQSGALNESFSDIFAQFRDNGDWLIGEDTPYGACRDMSNPPAYNDPDKMSSYVVTRNDYGGVHTNNGIHNKVAYLLVQGDTFNGWTVTGIGQAKVEQLFYWMQTRYLTENTQFIDARNAAVWGAYYFAISGQYNFTANDVCQVRNAYTAVELGNGDANCDGVEENNPLDADGDGMPDTLDNCPQLANAAQRDLDWDKVGDACDPDIDGDGKLNDVDNCPLKDNPNQEDSNTNGIGDHCDDQDGDGRKDYWDNCISIHNPKQDDIDYDNIGDVCDPDRDGDGIANAIDNCPDKLNHCQDNEDKDAYGDACDLCIFTASADNDDTDGDRRGDACDPDDDGDGVPDSTDNCPKTPNTNQYDGDENDIGYACDPTERTGLEDGTTGGGTVLFPDALNPWRIVLPVCSQCSSPYLPEGYHQEIHLNLPTGFRARIVDSMGLPVTTSGVTSGDLDMVFFPAPHGVSGGTAPFGINTNQGTSSLAADQISYTLEIYPAEGTDPNETYPISIQVEAISYQVYLPLVLR